MSKKAVHYRITESGEYMRVLPSGQVSFSDSMLATMRDMREFDRAGYDVFLDDEPLIPKTGFLGWLNRVLDKLPIPKRKDGPK